MNAIRSIVGLGLLGLTALVYLPGLNGPFLFDDFSTFVNQPQIEIDRIDLDTLNDAAFAHGEFYPRRGLALVSYALNFHWAGHWGGERPGPSAFKVVNLVIHTAGGALIYLLSLSLLRRYASGVSRSSVTAGWSALDRVLPLVVTAVWLLHPIQLTTVLYVTQRMTSLSALFVLSGLIVFITGRVRFEQGRAGGLGWMLVAMMAGTGLGFLCKENAILLPFLCALVELFFFRREALSSPLRATLYRFYALSVVLPALAGLGLLLLAWDLVTDTYTQREYGVFDRLLTQPRVLTTYMSMILVPNIRWFGLFHDDVSVSAGWWEPWTTTPAVIAWVILACISIWGARRRYLWSFAILWFLVAHALESSIIGLEMMFEHRNYVPSYGLVLAGTYYGARGLERLAVTRGTRNVIFALVVAVIGFVTFTRATVWDSKLELMEFGVRNHPGSSRYHAEFALQLSDAGADLDRVYRHWRRAAELNPNDALALSQMGKLVQYRLGQLEGSGHDTARAGAAVDDLFAAGLGRDPARLEELGRRLSSEIERRLRTRPFEWNTTIIANEAQRCARAGAPICLAMLPRVQAWVRAALGNPRVSTSARALLMSQLAGLYLIENRFDEALDLIRRAGQLRPRDFQYPYMLATLHLSRGELTAAHAAIVAAERTAEPTGTRRRDLLELKERYEAERKATSAASGG